VVRAELRQRLRLIWRDAYDGNIEIIELFQGIAEIAGFLGAARGIGAGVEVDQYALACVIGEGNGVSGVVGKRKGRAVSPTFKRFSVIVSTLLTARAARFWAGGVE